MKYVLWIVGILVVLVAAMIGLQMAASERVEVVELITMDENGAPATTRLWVVDHQGSPYLRGESQSGWFQRLQSQELVEMTRNGETLSYRHELQNDQISAINQLMRDKYTWGDEVIEFMVGSREQSNAVKLTVNQP